MLISTLALIILLCLGMNLGLKAKPKPKPKGPTPTASAARVSTNIPGDEIQWILNRQAPLSGAMLLAQKGSWVEPYFANIALTNVLRMNTSAPVLTTVRRWMEWYISKLEYPAPGVANISDWDSYDGGARETSRHYADSTDSYCATFLTLARRYLDASGDRSYMRGLVPKFRDVAAGAWFTFDPSKNLTCAKPSYCAFYLMDNLEVWQGMRDFADLLFELSDPTAYEWHQKSAMIRSGIESLLYNKERGFYVVAYGEAPPNWTGLNPGVAANMYTMVYGIPEALEPTRRARIYNLWSGVPRTEWINRTGDHYTSFPLSYFSEAARLNGDTSAVQGWIANVEKIWFPNRDYTWNTDEASFYALRLDDSL